MSWARVPALAVALGVAWCGSQLVGCGPEAQGGESSMPGEQGGPVYPDQSAQGAEQAPLHRSPCGPGVAFGSDGRCPPAAMVGGDAGSSVPVVEPPRPKPPPLLPGTVRGGLARGSGDAADKALLAGDQALLDDKPKVAERNFRRARQLAPKDPAPRVGLVRARLVASGIVTDYAAAPGNSKLRALLTQLDQALKLDPDYGPAHVERGRVLLILGEAEPALAALERGRALAPGDPEAHSALGVALLATGKTEPALERFRTAVDLDPENPDRLRILGTAYMLRGRVPAAITMYERAVRLAPRDARAQGDLGTAYLAHSQAKKALIHLRKAVALDERATFLSNLGYAYQLMGKLDLAITTYRRAIQLDGKLGSAWINLGTALAKQGKLDEAEKALQKALKLDPTDPRAKANLAELADLRKKKNP